MNIAERLYSFLVISCLMMGVFVPSVGVTANEKSQETKHPALTVTTVSPKMVDWPILVPLSGGIFPWQEASVSSQASGLRIENLLVDVGDEVKKGQLLAELDRETLNARLAQQQASVRVAEAALAEAKANARRAREVRGSAAMSEQQISQYLIAEQSAKASVEAAKAGLKSIQLLLNQTHIYAPDSGVITKRNASLGQVVQAGTLLFSMIRQNRLEWRADVSAEQVQKMAVGQKALLQLGDGVRVEGKVRIISPNFNAATRMGEVYVALAQNSAVRAGMFASGSILTAMKKAIVIPSSAVILRDGYSYVFLVNGQNKVRQEKVKTGRRQQAEVEILSPLPLNSQVVDTGGAFLNDGDTVLVVSKKVAEAKE
jgi:RND family efflux transporter MFP subunit